MSWVILESKYLGKQKIGKPVGYLVTFLYLNTSILPWTFLLFRTDQKRAPF